VNTNKGKNKCASKGGISTQDLSMDKYGTLVDEDHEIFSYGIFHLGVGLTWDLQLLFLCGARICPGAKYLMKILAIY